MPRKNIYIKYKRGYTIYQHRSSGDNKVNGTKTSKLYQKVYCYSYTAVLPSIGL